MAKTKVQLCDRTLSGVNDTMSEVQAWIMRAGPPEGTDTRVTDFCLRSLSSIAFDPRRQRKRGVRVSGGLGEDINAVFSD